MLANFRYDKLDKKNLIFKILIWQHCFESKMKYLTPAFIEMKMFLLNNFP